MLPTKFYVDSATAGEFDIDGTKHYRIEANLLDQNNVYPPGESMFVFNEGDLYDLSENIPRIQLKASKAYMCLLLPVTREGDQLIIGAGDGENQQNAAEISLDFSKSSMTRTYDLPPIEQTRLSWDNARGIPNTLHWDARLDSEHEGVGGGQAQAVQLNITSIQESVSILVVDDQGNIRYAFDKEHQQTANKPGYGGTNVFDLGPGVYVMALLKYNPNKPHYTFEVGDPRRDGSGTISEVP